MRTMKRNLFFVSNMQNNGQLRRKSWNKQFINEKKIAKFIKNQ